MKTMRTLFLWGASLGLLAPTLELPGQVVGSAASKENLDLPANAAGERQDEDEEFMETVVFLGHVFEGNAFIYVSSDVG